MKQEMKRIPTISLMIPLSALLFAVASCSTEPPGQRYVNGSAVTYVGTSEYNNKVSRFKVNPEQAWRLLAEHIRKEKNVPASRNVLVGLSLSILVEDSYQFHYKQKVGGIPLAGYYVDGNTGEVEFKQVEGSVPYPYQH